MFSNQISPVLKLPLQVDLQRLNEVFNGQGVYSKIGDTGTISLMHRKGVEDPWLDGITKSVLKKNDPLSFSEADFNQYNPGLAGTYFESVYRQLSEKFIGKIGRVRLFKREVQTSSSLHQDLDVRFHVALHTTPGSFLVFPNEGVFKIPADGHVYLVDTTRPHFAVNADPNSVRIHMVCSTYCGFLEHRDREEEILKQQRAFFSQISSSFF